MTIGLLKKAEKSMTRFGPFGHQRAFASGIVLAFSVNVVATTGVFANELEGSPIRNRSIGYVMSEKYLAVYQTPEGRDECPEGFNIGPREQFSILFPSDGTKRNVVETQLALEGEIWHPEPGTDPFPFKQAAGKIAIGLNLDGREGPKSFMSPEGERGIDNELFRAVGCINNYRGPDGTNYFFVNQRMRERDYNRTLIEITELDSLVNDDQVVVTYYHGRDPLPRDASGKNVLPRTTQRVDDRWGREFIHKTRGKIVEGMLTTEPVDVILPERINSADAPIVHAIRGSVLKLRLTPDSADGLIGGYSDVDSFYDASNKNWGTHFQSYGQQSMFSLYKQLKALADGYPDPRSGENTAISSAWQLKFTQAFILHPAGAPESDHGPGTNGTR